MKKDIKLADFLNLSDCSEYVNLIKNDEEYQIEVDTFKIGDINQLKFGIIKDIQSDFENKITIDFLKQIEYANRICKSINNIDIFELSLKEFCQGSCWLLTKLIELNENESELLGGYVPSQEEVEAGIDSFNGLGIQMQIRNLANNDVTKFEDIRNTKYETCFIELYIRKIENEYQKRLHEVYKNKTH